MQNKHPAPGVLRAGLALLFPALTLSAAMTVSITSTISSPAHVGQPISFTAVPSGASGGVLWYRFRVQEMGDDYRMVQDYGPPDAIDWAATEQEGMYNIEASIENVTTGETAVAVLPFQFTSNVSGAKPAMNPTANPLVFLYSAPSCPSGMKMMVQFAPSAGGAAQHTPYKACNGTTSMNFFLAGLRASTGYTANHIIANGVTPQEGPAVKFTSGAIPAAIAAQFPQQGTVQSAPAGDPDPILLEGTLLAPPIATDLSGNIIWYYPGNISLFTRPQAGGSFFGVVQNYGADPSFQNLVEFDLTGRTTRETNAGRINQQLVAMGARPIDAFHHEARQLPGGRIVVLGGVEQILANVQGPAPVNILGDAIIVLDANLQVVWTWDTFDHLDITRQATLGDTCNGEDCPPLMLNTTANDWTHGNCVQLTPDGNFLYSTRSQDWVIKIDYNNGNGAGDILWKLGLGGDFQITSTDPSPWFSHQHDPELEHANASMLTVLDNGNVRQATNAAANSRGQVLQLDEANHTASLVVNDDLGQFSIALGSAQRLPGGTYSFLLGWLPDGTSLVTQMTAGGQAQFAQSSSLRTYRTFRMPSLYEAPQ